MIIKDKQIEELKPYIENIIELVQNDNVQEVLDAIDDIIVNNILGNNDEPDEEGIKLQKLYDEIFKQNNDKPFYLDDRPLNMFSDEELEEFKMKHSITDESLKIAKKEIAELRNRKKK